MAISIGRSEKGTQVPPISEGRSPRDHRRSDVRAISTARTALVGGDADLATIATELGLTLRTDLLVPLSRWVTPPILPRRFDARFFAAALPTGARVTFEGEEVAGHAWMTPAAALAAMADDRLAMWIPTSGRVENAFTTGAAGRGQPQVFLPGSRRGVFETVFSSGIQTWRLNGKTASLSPSSRRC